MNGRDKFENALLSAGSDTKRSIVNNLIEYLDYEIELINGYWQQEQDVRSLQDLQAEKNTYLKIRMYLENLIRPPQDSAGHNE